MVGGRISELIPSDERGTEAMKELLKRPLNPRLDIIVRPHVPTLFELLRAFIRKRKAKP